MNFSRASRVAVLIAVAAIGWAAAVPAHAQLTRGAITGTVTDTTGASLPGASVTVLNLGTNRRRTAVTNNIGFYRVPALEPGPYTVHVEMSGFASVETTNV
ncbi:MAG TPA: carboxypeptidase-like regulatory domain-containing protein, partial [Vicinamibacteria bacterium]|nr:carboxypeptidase-like regulatory domain-containing protein [Vicinamibacteria bacterium]